MMSDSNTDDALDETKAAPAADTASPTLLGNRYRITGQLGRGGMGTVHLAVDTVLGVEVALKVVAQSGGSGGGSAGLRGLRDEVLLAQQVTHENVCRTFDLEEVDGEWLVKMEYVRGETLAQRLASVQRLPLPQALDIARQIAEGIDASHRKGIVHRDLKPHNVMIEHGTGRVVIMDFGIARHLAQRGDDRIDGTPHYMAPEQTGGHAVDARTDLYALGCVIYEMLVGEVVFPAGSVRDAAQRHAVEPPPDVRTRLPDAPSWLATLLLALLEKDPARRPSDARAVATQLAGPRWTPELRQLRTYTENTGRPALSPDATLVAYTSDRERRDHFRLYVEPIAGGPARVLTPPDLGMLDVTWAADGHSLLAVTRDGRALRVDPATSVALVVAEGVKGAVECADGLLLLLAAGTGTRLVVRDMRGGDREVYVSDTPIETVRCDRTGRLAVFARLHGGGPHPPADLWLVSLDDAQARPLTDDGLENSRGVFHPDGRSILYSSSRAGQLNLWEAPLTGGTQVPITTGFGPDDAPTTSADGRLLLYNIDDGATQLFAFTDGQLRTISTGARQDFESPVVSQDGREVVSVVTPWGRASRIMVVTIEDLEERDLGEGVAVTFSADGQEVIYATEREVRAIPRAGGPSRLICAIGGLVRTLLNSADGDLHLMVRLGAALEAWVVPCAGGTAAREAAAPIGFVAPAPAGGWRVAVRLEADEFRARVCAPGMVLDDPTAREISPDNGRVVWSAEGRYLFHAEGGGVTRLEVSTGTTTRVANFKTGGFAVSPDGEILYLTLMSPHVRRHVITNFGDRPRP